MNQAVADTVEDLTVPEELLEAATAEAKTLPKLEINKLDLQWLQVSRCLSYIFLTQIWLGECNK